MMIERGAAFGDGEIVDVGGKMPIKIIRADDRARTEYTIQAGEHLGTQRYTVLQVLIPDPRNGCFPGDPGCASPYANVPVLRLVAN
jgi:hypothetical protein